MRKTIALAMIALLLTSLVPVGSAHAAPAARSFETRIMHDHNDDSAFLTVQGKHGFDAIALDVREGYDLATGPVMIFRLLLNGGCSANPAAGDCPELSHVVTFKAGDADKSVTFKTADAGATWSGDAPRYEGPTSINDGTRFAVEAWMPMASLGVAPGSELTDWFVEGYAGAESADNMPEGAIPGYDDPLGAAFVIDSYTVKLPDYYLDIEAGPTAVDAKKGEEVRWAFNVTSKLDLSQNITFATVGLPAAIERGSVVESEGLAPGATRTYEVVLTPEQAGTVTVIVTSDMGGAVAAAFQVKLAKANTGLSFVSPEIPAGGDFSHTFGVPGTVAYHDHNNMAAEGTITVQAANGTAVTHTIVYDGEAFAPAALTISVGDTVIWQNDGDADMAIMASGEGHHDHGDHDHGHADEKESPGAPLLFVGLALLGAVFVARRR